VNEKRYTPKTVWKQTEGEIGSKKEHNEGKEMREEYVIKGNQDKVNKKVKIKQYKGGKKGKRKILNREKN
jgi:hypothetical protein